MAYNTDALFKKATEAIKKDVGMVFFEDVLAFLGVATSTFYEHFPKESEKYREIEELLQKNKTATKKKLRTNWENCDNPNAWKYLYLLIGNMEDRHALHGSKTENKTEFSGGITLTVSEEAKKTVDEILE